MSEGHDDHGHGKQSFISKYIFSYDHKMIDPSHPDDNRLIIAKAAVAMQLAEILTDHADVVACLGALRVASEFDRLPWLAHLGLA